MDVVAGTVISSIESTVMTAYHSILMYFHMDPYSRHEGFTSSQTGFPIGGDTYTAGRGEGSDDTYTMYKPYLRHTEFSTRQQRDNHRWPTSREMNGSLEQTLNKHIVLPCNYPSPGLIRGHARFS